jgi:S-adenosylmethionine hydrolase
MNVLSIILGASRWPKADTLVPEPKFERAADRVFAYVLSLRGLHLNRSNVLWLFDSDLDADKLDEQISNWLAERIPGTSGDDIQNVFVYYVGHGHVGGNDLYLTLRGTRGSNLEQSSLRVSSLARTLTQRSRNQGKFLFLDCCYAAKAVSALQLPDPNGFVLLAASAAYRAAQVPPDFELPAFSRALVETLEQGCKDYEDRMSVHECCSVMRERLSEWNQPEPELYPVGPRGDELSNTPIFPNPERSTSISLDDLSRELYSRVVELDRRGRARASALQDQVGKVERTGKWRSFMLFAVLGLLVILLSYPAWYVLRGSTRRAPLIVLQTDYGTKSPYMATLSGSIYSINSDAKISVITADINAFDVAQSAWTLWRASRFYPKQSIFVAIANPGGLTGKPIVIVTKNDQKYVGYDNGTFDYVVDAYGYSQGFEIASPDLTPADSKDLFGGADLFGPTAAKLSIGFPVEKVGPAIAKYVPKLSVPSHVAQSGAVSGAIVDIDGFGNATTNVTSEDMQKAQIKIGDFMKITFAAGACPKGVMVQQQCQLTFPVKSTYGYVSEGMPVAIVYDGCLQLALNTRNFANTYKVTRLSEIKGERVHQGDSSE